MSAWDLCGGVGYQDFEVIYVEFLRLARGPLVEFNIVSPKTRDLLCIDQAQSIVAITAIHQDTAVSSRKALAVSVAAILLRFVVVGYFVVSKSRAVTRRGFEGRNRL